MWPDRRLLELFKTEFPIVLAPMAGVMDADLVIAASQGGALGSVYGFLQGAWPFGLVEAIWAVVALRRWSVRPQ